MEITKEYLDKQFKQTFKLTKEYLDKKLENFATKDDLKAFATKEDLKDQTKELKGYVKDSFEVQQVYIDERLKEFVRGMQIEVAFPGAKKR